MGLVRFLTSLTGMVALAASLVLTGLAVHAEDAQVASIPRQIRTRALRVLAESIQLPTGNRVGIVVTASILGVDGVVAEIAQPVRKADRTRLVATTAVPDITPDQDHTLVISAKRDVTRIIRAREPAKAALPESTKMVRRTQAAKTVHQESTRALHPSKAATTAAPDATPQRVCHLVPIAQLESTKTATHKEVAKIVPLGNIKVTMARITAGLVIQVGSIKMREGNGIAKLAHQTS